MEPMQAIFTVFFAIFLWWFSTGAIMAIYGRPLRIMQSGFVILTLVMLLAFGGILITRSQASLYGVYLSITCGVIVWGWQIASYYLGFITGPQSTKVAVTNSQNLWQRFNAALRFSLYHELLAVLTGVLLTIIVWSQANQWALWIYMVLWLMHASAKLNVFLGVRNFRIEMLPDQMRYLDRLIGKRAVNRLFPVSMVIALSTLFALIYQAISPNNSPQQTAGFLLLTTMLALGVLEHGLLVLPLPATLWGWGIRAIPDLHDTNTLPQPLGDGVGRHVSNQLLKVSGDE